MPTALIKVTQGAVTDVPGNAVQGVQDGATTVVFSNGDDTGVVAWTYQLLYTPPSSGIAPTTQGPSVADTFTMATPDAPGSYRMKLTVADAAGNEDVDIRNFVVPFPNSGIIVPPYQGLEPPRPLTGPLAKPDEMNIGGHSFGWDGDEDTARIQLYQAVEMLDAGGYRPSTVIQTPGNSATPIVGIPFANRPDGTYEVEARFEASLDGTPASGAMLWRRGLFYSSSGAPTQIGSTQTPAADIVEAALAGIAVAFGTTVSAIRLNVTGLAATNINWRAFYKILHVGS